MHPRRLEKKANIRSNRRWSGMWPDLSQAAALVRSQAERPRPEPRGQRRRGLKTSQLSSPRLSISRVHGKSDPRQAFCASSPHSARSKPRPNENSRKHSFAATCVPTGLKVPCMLRRPHDREFRSGLSSISQRVSSIPQVLKSPMRKDPNGRKAAGVRLTSYR
jgi:hypothetical protein